MLPSSPSQLARYGYVNHYKKFWLLQTQLEKQEQSSSSSTAFSLQGTPATVAAGHPGYMKDGGSKSSSLIAHHGSGDYHSFVGPQIGVCRLDAAGAGSSCSRGMSGIPANLAMPSSLNLDAAYNNNAYGFINLRASQSICAQLDTSPRDMYDRPRLSLAVNCENVSEAANPIVSASTSSSAPSLSMPSSQNSNGADEQRSCSGKASKTGRQYLSCLGPSRTYLSSSLVKPANQLCVDPGFGSRQPVVPETPILSKLSSSSIGGNPRTCTLCGTSRTPLWRSGPNGPKSLCNACGIRVKKTKKMEAALQVARGNATTSSQITQFKATVKRKHASEFMKEATLLKKNKIVAGTHTAKQELGVHTKSSARPWAAGAPKLSHLHSASLKNSATALAADVEEAAVLLMALSCGLVL